jgi:hypothetical protein
MITKSMINGLSTDYGYSDGHKVHYSSTRVNKAAIGHPELVQSISHPHNLFLQDSFVIVPLPSTLRSPKVT